MINFVCLFCGRNYSVKDEYAGKRTKCPKCGQEIRVPAGESQSVHREVVHPLKASGVVAISPPTFKKPVEDEEPTDYVRKSYYGRQQTRYSVWFISIAGFLVVSILAVLFTTGSMQALFRHTDSANPGVLQEAAGG